MNRNNRIDRAVFGNSLDGTDPMYSVRSTPYL